MSNDHILNASLMFLFGIELFSLYLILYHVAVKIMIYLIQPVYNWYWNERQEFLWFCCFAISLENICEAELRIKHFTFFLFKKCSWYLTCFVCNFFTCLCTINLLVVVVFSCKVCSVHLIKSFITKLAIQFCTVQRIGQKMFAVLIIYPHIISTGLMHQ